MIHYLITLTLFSSPLKNHSIDTLDFWHIYYNKEKIKEFSEASKENVIQLKARSIKLEDSLCIKYFSDTRCTNCSLTLYIPTDGGISFFEVPKSTKTISLSLEKLKMLQVGNKMQPMTISLSEHKGSIKTKDLPLFTIKME